MILDVYVDGERYPIRVPQDVLEEGQEFFSMMDRDMDRGWQMSRDYVEHPDTVQRCQIAADRILTALHNENQKLAVLMAGYILSRLPGARGVDVDTHGEMSNTEILIDAPRPGDGRFQAPV
jgi:hypothetical protein